MKNETTTECILRHADDLKKAGLPVRAWTVAQRSGFEMWVVRPILDDAKIVHRYADLPA